MVEPPVTPTQNDKKRPLPTGGASASEHTSEQANGSGDNPQGTPQKILAVSGTGKREVTVSRFSKADHLLIPVMVSGFEKLDPTAGYLALISLLEKVSVDLAEFKRQLEVSGVVVCYGVGERLEEILGGQRMESVIYFDQTTDQKEA